MLNVGGTGGGQKFEYPNHSGTMCKNTLKIIKKIRRRTRNLKHEPVMRQQIGAQEIDQGRHNMILDMLDIGVVQVHTANYYVTPKTTVSSIIRGGRVEKQYETRGRKKKLSSGGTKSLLKVVDELSFKPVSKIASAFNQFSPIPVSKLTVRHGLKDDGIQNYTAVSKLHLSPKRIKANLRWATIHKEWDNNQWNKVVFSDEQSFTVRPTSLKKLTWRKANKKFELRNLVPTFKSGYVAL